MEKLNIIIISGLPGVGKSTLSKNLAKELKIPVFSVDPIESAIIKSGIVKSFKTGLSAYLVAETLADEQLSLGISVIVDAVNPVQEARHMWTRLGKKYNAKLIIIECILEKNIHKKRIESRIRNMHGLPEVTWKDVQNRRREYIDWQEERLIIDTAKSPRDTLKQSLKHIHINK